jgi:hypothetical protein
LNFVVQAQQQKAMEAAEQSQEEEGFLSEEDKKDFDAQEPCSYILPVGQFTPGHKSGKVSPEVQLQDCWGKWWGVPTECY